MNDQFDGIREIQLKLETFLQDAIVLSRVKINEIEQDTNKTAVEVEELNRNVLNNLEKQFKEKIDNLKEKARVANVNVNECFKQNEQTLLNLPKVAINQIQKNAQIDVNKVFNKANDARAKVSGTYS